MSAYALGGPSAGPPAKRKFGWGESRPAYQFKFKIIWLNLLASNRFPRKIIMRLKPGKAPACPSSFLAKLIF